ncbi:hypothetical protein [Lysinibacillus odysseyi]|uniref:Aminodeoxychorismate lyase n=1 Tax=Lysinibacillus odysseyi 34hs-1 = NBRC 100172 TaxID=1220589 RepID=A0A0A3IDL2_9BACI|nr:hypothetical protein [Lysinibacillus odysseyi]KGR81575.1 hypothetical protein CD32_19670 [Lysinibacillus odysseyi 34hs-1 = NBRC 100172]
MKKLLRGIGIGLFLAGAALTVLDLMDSPLSQESNAINEKEISALQQQLADANKEIASLKAASTPSATAQNESEKAAEQEPSANKPETAEPTAISGTIYIYEGVSLYDIGKQAEDAGIIANGRELELFLSKPDYSRSIQKGQFELSSTMTLEEMAKTLTGKKPD